MVIPFTRTALLHLNRWIYCHHCQTMNTVRPIGIESRTREPVFECGRPWCGQEIRLRVKELF